MIPNQSMQRIHINILSFFSEIKPSENASNFLMQKFISPDYHKYPKYWDSCASANSVDPDQTALQSAQELHSFAFFFSFLGGGGVGGAG